MEKIDKNIVSDYDMAFVQESLQKERVVVQTK